MAKACPQCGLEVADDTQVCPRCGTNFTPGATRNRPGAPDAMRSSSANYSGYAEYAGFWRRFVAYIIDGIVGNVIVFVLSFIIGIALAAVVGNSEEGAVIVQLIGALVGIVVIWLYYALMESSSNQATFGKMAMGLQVTDVEGYRISFGRATGRFFGKILSGLILGIGYLMIAFTERKQGLHDSMAGTLVLKR